MARKLTGAAGSNVIGTDEAHKALDRLAEVSLSAAVDVVAESATNIQADARKDAPVDTGRLRSSIRIKFDTDGLSAVVWTDVEYAAVMEYGRKAGKRQPPTDALRGWLGRHGIDPGAAWVVARAIGEHGIEPNEFMSSAAEYEEPHYVRRMETELQKALKKLG